MHVSTALSSHFMPIIFKYELSFALNLRNRYAKHWVIYQEVSSSRNILPSYPNNLVMKGHECTNGVIHW